MSKHRNRKTNCAQCRYEGPRVHVNGIVYATCLRRRMDGEAHALPQEWLDALASQDARCDLFEPILMGAALELRSSRGLSCSCS